MRAPLHAELQRKRGQGAFKPGQRPQQPGQRPQQPGQRPSAVRFPRHLPSWAAPCPFPLAAAFLGSGFSSGFASVGAGASLLASSPTAAAGHAASVQSDGQIANRYNSS